ACPSAGRRMRDRAEGAELPSTLGGHYQSVPRGAMPMFLVCDATLPPRGCGLPGPRSAPFVPAARTAPAALEAPGISGGARTAAETPPPPLTASESAPPQPRIRIIQKHLPDPPRGRGGALGPRVIVPARLERRDRLAHRSAPLRERRPAR